MKYIAVTGGVLSGLGKGIAASSIGRLLKSRGFKVTSIKIDPYLNVDPGTMSPYQHGEVFVLGDGGEVDLDLGNYERFLDEALSSDHNITTGKVYHTVIEKEREGKYLGKTVQIIPHITDVIKRRIRKVARESGADITIVEVGGTVGDIESMPFLEALRQMHREEGGHVNFLFIHTTLVPMLGTVGEFKTKPTQHSVKLLQEAGIQPDVLVLRTQKSLTPDIRRKVALFCNVDLSSVIESIDAETIYEVPLLMLKEKLDETILKKLDLPVKQKPELKPWKDFLKRLRSPKRTVRIGLVGKYVELHDAYKSISESFTHAGAANECRVDLDYIHSEYLTEENADEKLGDLDGILVAPGFGSRGIEGKILAARYAREHNIPYLGICLGMQCSVIEFARNVLGFENANSTEMNRKTPYPVIDLMEEQKGVTAKGGTMRLGAYPCVINPGSKVYKAYGTRRVNERHRHRYEFNNTFLEDFEKAGMKAAGINPDTNLVEIMEITSHRWYVGTQFHPEYRSTVLQPHPLFVSFVKAALLYAEEKSGKDQSIAATMKNNNQKEKATRNG